MPSTYLSSEDHVVRYVPWARLVKADDDETVIGVQANAFKLRQEEAYLSATWVEFFEGEHEERVCSCVHTIRASKLKPRPKSAFAIGVVGDIEAECRVSNRKIRFIHEPESDNPAHAALRNWPREDDELLSRLAESAWSTLVLNKDVT